MIFCLFGICWVMPQRVADLLDCWSCNFRQHRNIVVWRIVPHCLMWCIWRERNSRSFEDRERSILEFKSFFFSTLLEWCLVLPSLSCISLSGLLEHCTLISWCLCLFSTFPMYGAVFFQYTFKLLIKKKILLGKDDFTCAGGDLCEWSGKFLGRCIFGGKAAYQPLLPHPVEARALCIE